MINIRTHSLCNPAYIVIFFGPHTIIHLYPTLYPTCMSFFSCYPICMACMISFNKGGNIGLIGRVSQAIHRGDVHALEDIPRTLTCKEVTWETVFEGNVCGRHALKKGQNNEQVVWNWDEDRYGNNILKERSTHEPFYGCVHTITEPTYEHHCYDLH